MSGCWLWLVIAGLAFVQGAAAQCPVHPVRHVTASLPSIAANALPSCTPRTLLEAVRSASSVRALGPWHALGRGVQTVGDTRRMRRFVSKLVGGQNVTISVAGGSVSRGYGDSIEIPWQSQGCATSNI